MWYSCGIVFTSSAQGHAAFWGKLYHLHRFYSTVVTYFTAEGYLSKMAHPKVKALVSSAVSLLAGIPSVLYSLVGMPVLVPAVRVIFHIPDGASLFSAIIVLSVMVLPSIRASWRPTNISMP